MVAQQTTTPLCPQVSATKRELASDSEQPLKSTSTPSELAPHLPSRSDSIAPDLPSRSEKKPPPLPRSAPPLPPTPLPISTEESASEAATNEVGVYF